MQQLKRFSERIFPSCAMDGQLGSIDCIIRLAQAVGTPLIGLRKESRLERGLLLLYGVSTLLFLSGIYIIFEFYDIALNLDDLDSLTQNICLSFLHLQALCKITYVLFNLKAVCTVIDRLRLLTKRYVITKQQLKTFQSGEFETKALVFAYSTLVIITVLLAEIMLFTTTAMSNGEVFPFRVQLPAWLLKSIRLTYMAWAVFILALQVVAIDCLNITIITHMCLQLKILNEAFKELLIEHETKKKQHTVLKDPNEQLRLIISHHCELKSLRQQVEDIFRWPMLVQFASSLIISAMIGFRVITLTGVSNSDIIIYLDCPCVLFELFLYCWCGDEFIEQSNALVTIGFSTTWYDFDRDFKHSLLIFMINAQTPMFFTAGGLMTLSLPSFAGILSKSFSYITVLRQIYGIE